MNLLTKMKAYKLRKSIIDEMSKYMYDRDEYATGFKILSFSDSTNAISVEEYYISRLKNETSLNWSYHKNEPGEKVIYELLKRYYEFTK